MLLRRAIPTFLALGTAATPALAWAADPAQSPSIAFIAFRTLASLAFVLALLFGTLHLLRRARLGAPGALAKSPLVASRGRLDLGTGREIRLVEVSGRLLVVGVTNESMQLLADLPQTEAQGSESASPVGARNAPAAHPTELPWQPSGIGRFLQRLITSF